MHSADLAVENRPWPRRLIKTGFDLVRAIAGTLILVGAGFMLIRYFNTANPEMRLVLPFIAPMFLWTMAALCTGGKRPGLSLAPEHIWIPVNVSVVITIILYANLVPMLYLGPGLIMSVLFSTVLALCVTTRRPQHAQLLLRPVLAGLGIMGVAWLAVSIVLPAAIRQNIAELAGNKPYTLYVPDPNNRRITHELVAGPDFWTFQSMLSDERILHCHMHLVVGDQPFYGKHYHWSFFDGFRFVENGEGKC
ncbi:hypothetical protein GAO09_28705 [Rhizobiales bacterium RZME27]|jgi:hypothetical protein|uniref:Uncharacterized protein n=1 Tax=Endobacterium cereale TaxID=2663029 RepID=A0A6A8AGQ7_9HYPH|nr:hypothetical protein [Endobacterium cereale]MQY50014.1 hypothetical protein [Endobacterium cereale]